MSNLSLRATALMLCFFFCFSPVALAYQPSVPAIALEQTLKSPSVILMHPGTGNILIAKNEHEPRYIASVTKVMTMLLVMDAIEAKRISWDDEVVVSSHARSRGGSQIWLEEGERLTVEGLFLSVAVVSANDSAVALAEFVAGSEEGFVALMNERAKQLGCLNTTFRNACGLDTDGHLSSAYDVALMSQELLKHERIHDYLTVKRTFLPRAKLPSGSELNNTNKDLLTNYAGYDGLKTGKTDLSGWCLSATAKRGDLRLVAVVLGASTTADRKNDIVKLLDYGFANYQAKTFALEGDLLGAAPLAKGLITEVGAVAATDLTVLLPKGTTEGFKTVVEFLPLEAPLTTGQLVGTMTVLKGDDFISTIDLVAAQDVKRAPYWLTLFRMWQALYK